MNCYEFILKFALPDDNMDPELIVSALVNSGCTDALIGIGQKGRVALDFSRTAQSATDAMVSALSDVEKGIPGARFICAEPDVLGPDMLCLAKRMDS